MSFCNLLVIFLVGFAPSFAGDKRCEELTLKDSVPEKPFVLQLAQPEEVKEIRRLYNKFRDIFPFIQTQILLDSIKVKELLTVRSEENPDTVIGLIRWHKRRDGWSTVHEIAVHPNFQDSGLAQQLMEQIPKPRWLKCITENKKAMRFYKSIGMRKAGKSSTKSERELTVWADSSELPLPKW